MQDTNFVSTRAETDARLLAAVQQARDAGWVGSERGLAEELGLPPSVFYKVRNGLQSFPREGLFALERMLGLNPAYVRQGVAPPFSMPTQPGGEKLSVYERVRIAALALGQTADGVAAAMGLPPTKWKLLRAGSDAQIPGLAQALAKAIPSVSTAWLLMGIGLPQAQVSQPAPFIAMPEASLQPQVLHLPFVDVRARAGFVSAYLSGTRIEHLPLQPYLSKPDLRPPSDALLIEVEGDSMSPTLQPRDVLLIAPVQMSDWKYLSGGVYAVLFGQDHLVVKRVERNALATEGILRLVSDNPTGGHLDLPGPDLKAIFRVLAITRNL